MKNDKTGIFVRCRAIPVAKAAQKRKRVIVSVAKIMVGVDDKKLDERKWFRLWYFHALPLF